MIISRKKKFEEILESLKGEERIFLVGCGECATTCKSGGEAEILKMKEDLEKAGKKVTGWVIPNAPCVAPQIRAALAKNTKAVKDSDSVLVLACGLGIQSVSENQRRDKKPVHVGCDTLFMGEVDADGNFLERCIACGECVLEATAMFCPMSRCPKGMLNGPCGGPMNRKCEVDKERDCTWILIYEALKEKGKLDLLRRFKPPKDYSKMTRPHRLDFSQISAK